MEHQDGQREDMGDGRVCVKDPPQATMDRVACLKGLLWDMEATLEMCLWDTCSGCHKLIILCSYLRQLVALTVPKEAGHVDTFCKFSQGPPLEGIGSSAIHSNSDQICVYQKL